MIQRDCCSALRAFIIFSIDRINCCFFVFNLVRRIYTCYASRRLNLFYDIYSIINEHNQPRKKWLKKLFYNIICFVINHDLYVITFFIKRSLSFSLAEPKLIVIVNWIFHVSDFLRSFVISFKYCLISLSSYSSTDSGLFLSPLLWYSI